MQQVSAGILGKCIIYVFFRARETLQERSSRLEKVKLAARKRRLNESEQQTKIRLEKDKLYHRNNR